MTTYNKTTLKTFFENGDIPTGTNYADFIDSYVNLVDTSAQDMAGPLSTTELVTPKVSATNMNITGTMSANSISITGSLTTVDATFTGRPALNNGIVVSGDVSASNNIYCSAIRIQSVAIISALGTAQAAGAALTATICRLQGISDGQTTGFVLQANKTGLIQYLVNETATSANLWPPTGGKINNLSTNAAFAIAGGSSYTVFHTQASAYGVK